MSMHLQTDGIGADALSAEDQEVLRAQAGDASAFAPLMKRHFTSVLSVAHRYAPVGHLADDLASETFLFAWQNINRFRIGTNFGAWLRAIAWQLSRSRREREQCRLLKLEKYWELCESEVEDAAFGDSRVTEIFEVLATLPNERRQLVMLCDYDGCTGEEAANRLGRSAAWARITLHRTRRELREALVNKKCRIH